MKRRVMAIGVGSLVVLVVAWFLLLWSPKTNQLEKASEDRVVAETATDVARLELGRLKAAAARESELLAAQAAMVAAVPDDPEIASLLRTLDKIADESGVEFASFAPSPVASPVTSGPGSIGLSIQIEGRYVSVLELLDRILGTERVVVIDGISLSPARGESVDSVTMSITARAFTAPVPAAASAQRGATL